MLQLNPLLKDQVVFQAEKSHLINGKTTPNTSVELKMGELTLEVRSDSDGEFVFLVPPQSYGVTENLCIASDGETRELVLQYGDVFLFAGQSNMEYPMAQEDHFIEEQQALTDEKSIFFYVVPMPEFELKIEEETEADWTRLTADTLGGLSAVAYYAMKEHQNNHPDRIIGAVICSKGGTSASCWISEEDLAKSPTLNEEILVPFIEETKGKEKAAFDAEFAEYLSTYQQYIEKRTLWAEEHPELTLGQIKEQIGHSPWPPPANPYLFNRPGGLYQKMFKRIVPFTFSAVIWYQGEEDTAIAPLYEELLDQFIARWRKDLQTPVPFYILQLPIYADDPQHDWASVRAAQAQARQKYEATFLVTSLDCGEVEDIHPTEKSILGQRVGEILDALHYTSAPVAKIASWTSDTLVIEVEEAASLKLLDVQTIEVDVPIICQTIEENRLIIETTKSSRTVQYGWENAPAVSLFNEVGYPVAPFKFEKQKGEE